MQNQIIERIVALRKEMSEAGLRAVILPRTDAHLSEYISDHWHIVRYLSGFTGSAGTLVVTDKEALLWVDSRYFLQGAQQIEGTGIELMKEGLPDTPSISEYLIEHLSKGDTVGINGLQMSIDETVSLRKRLNSAGIGLNVDFDPIDRIWNDRPSLPSNKIFIHDEKYAGESATSKINRVPADAAAQGAKSYFTSALDEIAWVLNIRSNDVPCNPVATSFLYLSPSGSTLFVDEAKLTPEVIEYLKKSGVDVAPYSSVLPFLKALPENEMVLLAGSRASGAIASALEGHYVNGSSPIAMPKAVKNDVQIEGIHQAHIRDGVAMVRSLMEIQQTVAEGKRLTEMGVADILLKHRSATALYFDLSFESICGFGPHGAIVHYTANKDSDAEIHPGNLLLIDSGANYLDGTTDITRTIAIGNPTADMRHDFTLVMKGHIAIATSIFPEGTRGAQLDALARMPLWKEGKSYLHGTGHGVGHFLNVHEGPQSIRLNDTLAPLTPGMLTSNEPGVYLSDRYGIRCENLVLTIPYEETEFGKFYAFETITLCPFDRELFDTSIMSDSEIEWVNNYHRMVYDRLSPLMDETERTWLANATAPLSK